ncbi:MAG TPA: hypothetical protein VGK37_09665 [Casimicrobiaceae bacterium]|jgi:hypothetical protein
MSDALAHSPRERGHEIADISGRRIALTAAGLVAVLIVVALSAWAARALLRPDRVRGQAQVPPAIASAPQSPQLQSAPALDLDALRREKNTMLDEYAWIDRSQGVVRIPIERAMQLTVERVARRSAEKPAEAPR